MKKIFEKFIDWLAGMKEWQVRTILALLGVVCCIATLAVCILLAGGVAIGVGNIWLLKDETRGLVFYITLLGEAIVMFLFAKRLDKKKGEER